MTANLRELPIDERIRLVEDLWDSIAADQGTLPLKAEQREELDRRLDAYESDGYKVSPKSGIATRATASITSPATLHIRSWLPRSSVGASADAPRRVAGTMIEAILRVNG